MYTNADGGHTMIASKPNRKVVLRMPGRNREPLVSTAAEGLERLRLETAAELGIPNYGKGFRGDLPSRVNGSVGGYMVKKMIALSEQQLANSRFGG
jgi:small acid-soluble spore protein A (major alpha-type SASP)